MYVAAGAYYLLAHNKKVDCGTTTLPVSKTAVQLLLAKLLGQIRTVIAYHYGMWKYREMLFW